MFGVFAFGQPYFAQGSAFPQAPASVLDLCDATVISLMPARTVVSLMSAWTAASLMPARTVVSLRARTVVSRMPNRIIDDFCEDDTP